MNRYYGEELKTYNDKLVVSDGEWYPYFRAYLCNLGVADTRCGDLAEALMSKLHAALVSAERQVCQSSRKSLKD